MACRGNPAKLYSDRGINFRGEEKEFTSALRMPIGTQTITEEVLSTVLTEVEGILNSKPLGYISTKDGDLDPITSNHPYHIKSLSDTPRCLPQVRASESVALEAKPGKYSKHSGSNT